MKVTAGLTGDTKQVSDARGTREVHSQTSDNFPRPLSSIEEAHLPNLCKVAGLTLVQKHTADKSQDSVVPKNTTISEVNKSDSDGDQSSLLLSPTHKDETPSLNSSPSSTSSLASVPTAEEHVVTPDDHPPCTLGEKVMVETSLGYKFGKVKFIGPTEFSAGEWIGVALDRPQGKIFT